MRSSLVAFALAPLPLAACLLTTSLDGFTGGPNDTADGATVEASAQDGGDGAAPPGPVNQPSVIVSGIGGFFGAGSAQHMHLYYARNAGQWIFFYLPNGDDTHLRTRLSKDFMTWADGPALSLPQASTHDGRSFAVAYGDLAGHDVFHFAISLRPAKADRRHVHVRGVLGGSGLVFEPSVELGKVTKDDTSLDPDGPTVALLGSGQVVDVAGWYSPDAGTTRTANVVSWQSMDRDTGASWSSKFTPPFEVEVVPDSCNARQLVLTPSKTIALWESGDADPSPTGLRSATYDGSGWSGPKSAEFDAVSFDVNDWSGAAVGNDVHAVRFAGTSFVHRVLSGGDGNWHGGAAVPQRSHHASDGVVVLTDGTALRAVSLDSDGALTSTTFANGVWSAWKTEIAPGARREGLSGYSGNGGLAVAWVETAGAQQNIVGARLPQK